MIIYSYICITDIILATCFLYPNYHKNTQLN